MLLLFFLLFLRLLTERIAGGHFHCCLVLGIDHCFAVNQRLLKYFILASVVVVDVVVAVVAVAVVVVVVVCCCRWRLGGECSVRAPAIGNRGPRGVCVCVRV